MRASTWKIKIRRDWAAKSECITKTSFFIPITLFARSPQIEIVMYQKSMRTDADHLKPKNIISGCRIRVHNRRVSIHWCDSIEQWGLRYTQPFTGFRTDMLFNIKSTQSVRMKIPNAQCRITHKSTENSPEKIQTTQRLTRVGCLFARFEKTKVMTSKGNKIVLKMRLKYIQISKRLDSFRCLSPWFPKANDKYVMTQNSEHPLKNLLLARIGAICWPLVEIGLLNHTTAYTAA